MSKPHTSILAPKRRRGNEKGECMRNCIPVRVHARARACVCVCVCVCVYSIVCTFRVDFMRLPVCACVSLPNCDLLMIDLQ